MDLEPHRASFERLVRRCAYFPELLSLPGFVSDTRFRQCGAEDAYLAVDEIESPCSIRRRRIRVSLTAISMSEA
jgi:hypothetical protein